jgi:hypothetical protein
VELQGQTDYCRGRRDFARRRNIGGPAATIVQQINPTRRNAVSPTRFVCHRHPFERTLPTVAQEAA